MHAYYAHVFTYKVNQSNKDAEIQQNHKIFLTFLAGFLYQILFK